MLLLSLARSLFGILFVMRTMRVFRGRALVPARHVDACGLGALILISLIEFFAAPSPVVGTLVSLTMAAVPAMVFVAQERNQIALFRARVPLFIDHWILNMRLGSSVAHARTSALREESAPVSALLAPVFETTGVGGRRHLILAPAVLRELGAVSQTAHAALERLEALRAHVREAAEFRRKSGQAVRQAGVQCAVMLFMLIALSIFTVHRYGWARSGGFVTVAAALSILSTLVMVALSRKRKWNL